MKKIIITLSAFSLLLVSAGCKKFLDKEPDNRAKLTSPDKVSQLLASAYPQANYQAMAELSSDNVGDNVNNDLDQPSWSKLVQDLYLYKDNNNSGIDDPDCPEGYWFGCYKAIAAANLALETIAAAPDPQNYQAQKGEALVARAYSHFMLANFFAKFYDSTTASTDLGIPYVTESETVSIKKYDRKTVRYVYDMIKKDLTEGLPLIRDDVYPKTDAIKYHFTKSAASAFASRYYLYIKNYDSVIKYARAALPENNYQNNLRPWNTTYSTLPANGAGSISATYSKATENANLLLVETQSWWNRFISGSQYGLTQDLGRMFTGDAPVSEGPWSMPLYSFGSGTHKHFTIPKIDEYFVETSIGSGIGTAWQMVPLFSAEEVLFNLAEAYTYKGQTSEAIGLLNTYLSKRITLDLEQPAGSGIYVYDHYWDINEDFIKSYYGVTDLQEGLINTILDYRQAEFVHEGMRWFDILRYGIEVTHPYGSNQVVLTADNPHRVFQIPATAAAQAGLPLNPR